MKDRLERAFIAKILKEEWGEMGKAETLAIMKYTQFRTGRLRNGRSYRVSVNERAMEGLATETHVDYKRFIDMRKLRYGKKHWSSGQGSVVHRKGRPIHNKWIWHRVNVIAFRLLWDLTDEMAKEIREGWTADSH